MMFGLELVYLASTAKLSKLTLKIGALLPEQEKGY